MTELSPKSPKCRIKSADTGPRVSACLLCFTIPQNTYIYNHHDLIWEKNVFVVLKNDIIIIAVGVCNI